MRVRLFTSYTYHWVSWVWRIPPGGSHPRKQCTAGFTPLPSLLSDRSITTRGLSGSPLSNSIYYSTSVVLSCAGLQLGDFRHMSERINSSFLPITIHLGMVSVSVQPPTPYCPPLTRWSAITINLRLLPLLANRLAFYPLHAKMIPLAPRASSGHRRFNRIELSYSRYRELSYLPTPLRLRYTVSYSIQYQCYFIHDVLIIDYTGGDYCYYVFIWLKTNKFTCLCWLESSE